MCICEGFGRIGRWVKGGHTAIRAAAAVSGFLRPNFRLRGISGICNENSFTQREDGALKLSASMRMPVMWSQSRCTYYSGEDGTLNL